MNGINSPLDVTFIKIDGKEQEFFFKTKAKAIANELDIGNGISDSYNELLNRISECVSKGSGWIIKTVDKHKLQPLRGSSYLSTTAR